MATVQMTRAAAKEFDRLDSVVKAHALAAMERLASWPNVSGAKPLSHAFKGHYRVRIAGGYRLVFAVAGDVLTVVSIARRDSVYDA